MKVKRDAQDAVNLDERPQETWTPEQLGRYCQAAERNLAVYAHRLGTAFNIAKVNCGRGGWLKWLSAYGFKAETARRYRMLAETFTEEEVAGVGLMEAFRVLGIDNVAKKKDKGTGTKPGEEDGKNGETRDGGAKSDVNAANTGGRKEASGGREGASASPQGKSTAPPKCAGGADETEDQLTPRQALLGEMRQGLPQALVALRKLIAWIMEQDCNLRALCWVEVGHGPVAVEVAGLKEDLARLEADMPAEAIRKAG